MKLISAKQKTSISTPTERINFSNEIEHLVVTENKTYKLSDFHSDIISFSNAKARIDVTISIICDRPYRKYTFVALNGTSGSNIIFDFQGDGRSINKYSNETDPIFKAGNSGIIDLYQIAGTTIHLVQHTLSPI